MVVRDAERRKQLGAWYTPPALVHHVTAVALADVGARGAVHVVDPACGDGRFLAEARRVLGRRARLTGVDVDPRAVAACREALPDAEVVEADALTLDWADRQVDVVLGNPPFLNQMAAATTRGRRSSFGGGAYADTAADFLALAVRLVRPGGRVALVLPQSILTTRDVAPIREAVRERAALRHVWWSPTRMFDAHVRTCALVFEVGAVQGEVTRACGPDFVERDAVSWGESWGSLLLDEPEPPPPTHGVLGDLATFSVDFRDQYYGLVPAVGDHDDGPPLVTSGLIEPGRSLWGERPVRFAKRSFAAPRVALDRLSPAMQRWAAQRLVPKILVANQTRTIEAVLDAEGAWLPGVPVITCTGDRLDEVLAVLSSPLATTWVQHRAAGSGLSHDTVRLGPSLLAGIPLP